MYVYQHKNSIYILHYTTLFNFRAIRGLAAAGIIQYNEVAPADEQSIVPNAEAHIMTRNLIKFETAELLTKIPAQAGIAQVWRYEYECQCECFQIRI